MLSIWDLCISDHNPYNRCNNHHTKRVADLVSVDPMCGRFFSK